MPKLLSIRMPLPMPGSMLLLLLSKKSAHFYGLCSCPSCICVSATQFYYILQSSPTNAVVNAWSYLSLRRTADLGRWLNRTTEAAALDKIADDLRDNFLKHLLTLNTTNTNANANANANPNANPNANANAKASICDGICATTSHTAVHSTFYALYV